MSVSTTSPLGASGTKPATLAPTTGRRGDAASSKSGGPGPFWFRRLSRKGLPPTRKETHKLPVSTPVLIALVIGLAGATLLCWGETWARRRGPASPLNADDPHHDFPPTMEQDQ
ncbi:hypothetical protein GCM10018773_58440 [Streptomyces candidus]|nr:hypothetical protein GCM10018773_58440 [Streptomyces candidus]